MDRHDVDTAARDATADLLERARAGDEAALNQLFERHLPPLRRWASGRLPRWARDIADTTDLIQETVLETLRHLDRFEHRGDGALQAYLRQGVINRIRNELRKLAIRGANRALDSGMRDEGTSPLEAAVAQQTLERYDAALQRLKPEEREAVVSRVEFNFTYAEIAEVLGKSSPDAARMLVVRSLVKLAEEMKKRRR
ncbi:MAG TPA: sigma-70 family RNA polymerase sigma factor [Vicinamibacterales bacterium]|nr:sigma-70 family RNA polymerase sigma factor [Vicinamibacterales bacterium]